MARAIFAAVLTGALMLSAGAGAREWPARPVTLVVPYAAGGPVDTIGRIMAARLSELLGQQVIIENVGGAGGMTGAARVAKATPDGYTVLLSGSAVLAINQTLYKKPLYNAVTDFEHAALFSDLARVLIARKSLPAEQISTALPQIQGNTVKAIVTLGLDRAPGLETLATAQELGLSGLDCGSWGSFSFPKGTADAIVQRLAKASNDAVETPSVRERFASIGVTIPAPERRTPDYLTKFVPSEIERWAGPIKASGASAD